MAQSLSCLLVHCVFSTKHREPLLRPENEIRLAKYMAAILAWNQCYLLTAGGMPDHLHLLVSLHRDIAVSVGIRRLKSNSSRWLGEEMSGFKWQRGYAAFSVSPSQIDRVTHYIENQKNHHRKKSFKDELRSLLKQHGVAFDEKYLWD